MPSNPRPERGDRQPLDRSLLEMILRDDGGPHAMQRLAEHLQAHRQRSDGADSEIDLALLHEIARLRRGLRTARDNQEQLKGVLQKLTSPPLHPAIFLGLTTVTGNPAALVCHENSCRIVVLAGDLDPCSLAIGDEVLLGAQLNVLVARSTCPGRQGGETGLFERATSDGRLVLRWHEEEVIVHPSSRLREESLNPGDMVRWSRSAWIAWERIERPRGDQLFLRETPTETFDRIGGLGARIAEIKDLFLLHLKHLDAVLKYELDRRLSVLLTGPPGTGKTMLARALANWLAELGGGGRSRFMHIKPGSFATMWYGETERKIREAFRIAREVGAEDGGRPAVMYFDEVDGVTGRRGESINRVDDKVMEAFAVELDGLESRGNVVVLASTNRIDSMDPAMLRFGRLFDKVIDVPRPNRAAALDILRRYFTVGLPYAVSGGAANGGDPAAAREELIDVAVSRLYAPNGDGDLAAATLRDGRQHRIRAADVMSGAMIAKIAVGTKERACKREIASGVEGIELHDLLSAIADTLDETARILTPANCRNHVDGLPQDVDVVRVDPVRRKSARLHRYLAVA